MKEVHEELNFGPYFLLHIIYNCIVNDDFARRITPTIDPVLFKSKERKFLYNIIKDYVEEYKQAPKDIFYELFQERKEELSQTTYDACMNLIREMKDINNSNPDYVLSKIHKAIRHFELEEALVSAAQLLKKKKHEDAIAVFLKAIRKPEEIKAGHYDFFEDTTYIESRLEGKIFKMKTLIEPLDKVIGGFNPTWLITFLGGAKAGKTFFLIEMAVAGLVQGLNVLFVSLEMGKKEIDDRFDMCIGFLGSEPDKEVEIMEYSGETWCKVKKVIPTIYDIKQVERNRIALKKLGGKLHVSDQSAARFNYQSLEVLMDEIEQTRGVLFDLVVIDYLGEMGVIEKTQKKKEAIAANCSGLKGLAKEKNVIMITAQQGNRTAMKSKTFKSDLISDAIEPVFISDMILSINQTEKEEKENVFRIYLANSRHGAQHAYIPLVRDFSRGSAALGLGKMAQEDDGRVTSEDDF